MNYNLYAFHILSLSLCLCLSFALFWFVVSLLLVVCISGRKSLKHQRNSRVVHMRNVHIFGEDPDSISQSAPNGIQTQELLFLCAEHKVCCIWNLNCSLSCTHVHSQYQRNIVSAWLHIVISSYIYFYIRLNLIVHTVLIGSTHTLLIAYRWHGISAILLDFSQLHNNTHSAAHCI